MEVSVEETSELGRKMTVLVPADKIEAAISERLNSLKGRVKIDGFRPGKVPLNVVKQRYGQQVRQEVMADEMQASYREAVLQEKLRPASGPAIEPTQIESGKDLTFIATFDVYPEITLCDFGGLTIDVPVSEVVEQDIEETIERMRQQGIEWNVVEEAAQNGHRITIDFTGKMNGEEFDGGKANDFPLILGEGGMIAGFEENLIGLKAGDEKSFTVTFPDDYGNKDLAGQEATFEINVKKVEEGTLPEVNAEFVKSFGINDGETETLKSEIRQSLEAELQQQLNAKTKEQVMQALLENNELTLPDSMVAQEIEVLRKQALENFKMENDSELPDSLFEEEARRRVKLGLMIGEIVNEQKLQVDVQLVNQRIQQLASQYQDPNQVIQYYQTNTQARASVESLVMEDQVVEWILDKVNQNKSKQSFADIVQPRQ